MPIIVVEGSIGSGKSVLTKALAKDLDATPILEGVLEDGDEEGNPWLTKYYKDIDNNCGVSVSFATQMWFLINRFNNIRNIRTVDKTYIIDRSLFGDMVFAKTQRDIGKMSQMEFETYSKLWYTFSNFVGDPDIFIYIRASISFLKMRIENRGRDIENGISDEYLEKLNYHYDDIFGYDLDNTLTVRAVDIEGEFREVNRASKVYRWLIKRCKNMISGIPNQNPY
jgi:deoxyadenosine/deoxycytidine kinase